MHMHTDTHTHKHTYTHIHTHACVDTQWYFLPEIFPTEGHKYVIVVYSIL